jgi:hypothetical protein
MRRVGPDHGREREIAAVRLDGGNVVLAFATFSDPVSPGDNVTLSVEPCVFCEPVYQVVAKNKR